MAGQCVCPGLPDSCSFPRSCSPGTGGRCSEQSLTQARRRPIRPQLSTTSTPRDEGYQTEEMVARPRAQDHTMPRRQWSGSGQLLLLVHRWEEATSSAGQQRQGRPRRKGRGRGGRKERLRETSAERKEAGRAETHRPAHDVMAGAGTGRRARERRGGGWKEEHRRELARGARETEGGGQDRERRADAREREGESDRRGTEKRCGDGRAGERAAGRWEGVGLRLGEPWLSWRREGEKEQGGVLLAFQKVTP